MKLIYDRVVEKLKKDSFLRYEQRKKEYRLKNSLPLQEQIVQKKWNKSHNQRQEAPRAYEDNRPIKPKEASYNSITKSEVIGSSQNHLRASNTHANQAQIEFKLQQPKIVKQTYEEPIRPIKPLQEQINPYPSQYEKVELVPCPAGCGRSFNPNSLAKHARNCKKVFLTPAEVVNFSKKREVEGMLQVPKKQEPDPPRKKVDYKAESQRFQASMRQSKGNQAVEQKDSREPCPKCGRKFDPSRVQTHYEICAKQTNNAKNKK